MSSIKEYAISTIGEPYKVKIEKNSKGFNFEVEARCETMEEAIRESRMAINILMDSYGEKKNEPQPA